MTDHTTLSSSGLLFGQRCEPQVRLDDAEVREKLLGLLVVDTRVDNDIITRDPVDWGGNAVLVASLQTVKDTKNLSSVTASASRVAKNETDSLLRVNDEDGANGESNALAVNVGSVLVVDHVVCQRNLALLVTNDRELEVAARDLVDVLDPAIVRVDSVCGETDELGAAAGELRFELCEGS